MLLLDIINWKRIGKSKSFGHIEIKIKDLLEGDVKEGWYPLKNMSEKKDRSAGELYLKFQYNSVTVSTIIHRNIGTNQ